MSLQSFAESEHYNSFWLVNAMSMPGWYSMERYYYDNRHNTFFFSAKSDDDPYTLYFDSFNQELDIIYAIDLSVRLKSIQHPKSDLVEIPRLYVNEKIRIQLEFLSRLPYTHTDLITVVEQQRDQPNFVLDAILNENANFKPIAANWDTYKIEVAFKFISKFIKVINLELKL